MYFLFSDNAIPQKPTTRVLFTMDRNLTAAHVSMKDMSILSRDRLHSAIVYQCFEANGLAANLIIQKAVTT